ncbi:hypothetical protein J1C67_05780 [Clostridium gasigenes]|uniref:hypothetical protein n=1 Tax=Clostridium gasigenes TaxID=94869 RepID=UPI0014383C0F|nr:hypothetical protein [Clostridium gasigenes]NKF07952.1 hypothetical protein [Clostridium gasigenes]QSW20671.1 hypothetical protein J1C67_05780 [Clostridium gasigenes]
MDTVCNCNQQTSIIVQLIPTLVAGGITILVAFLSLRYQFNTKIQQIKDQKIQENDENKNTVIKIAVYYLKEELIHNYKTIEHEVGDTILESKRKYEVNSSLSLPYILKYDLYKELKWNLMKYSDEKKLKDIIDIYTTLNLFNHPNGQTSTISSIYALSENDYKELTELKGKMDLVIKELDKNN